MRQAFVVPATRYEKALSDIWRDLLGLDRVGVNDNFFDLGGNSLLGIQAVLRVRERLDIDIPVVKLFQCPTIAALAKSLAGEDGEAIPAGRSEMRAQQRRAVLVRKGALRQPPHAAATPHGGSS